MLHGFAIMRNACDVRMAGRFGCEENYKALEVSVMALILSQAKPSVILPPLGARVASTTSLFDAQAVSRPEECKDDPVLRESRVRLYSAALST